MSPRPPRISVVVPSFQQARFLPQALDSVLAQGYPELELIVVDGGSTDGSVEAIQARAKDITWWVSEPDGGQAEAINKGFARATGEVLGWLNSDDYYLEGALLEVARAHARQPDAGLFTGNGLRVDEQGRTISTFAKVPIKASHDALRFGLDYVLQPATFFSRSAWQAVGGLKAELHWCLDWDLWIRIAEHFAAATIDSCLAASREHAETKTATGAFERWEEIRRLGLQHTGMPLTPGGLAYFLHTLLDYVTKDEAAKQRLPDLVPPLVQLWDTVNKRALARLTGREDGFPAAAADGAEPIVEDSASAMSARHLEPLAELEALRKLARNPLVRAARRLRLI